jgi:hypothetical protein
LGFLLSTFGGAKMFGVIETPFLEKRDGVFYSPIRDEKID